MRLINTKKILTLSCITFIFINSILAIVDDAYSFALSSALKFLKNEKEYTLRQEHKSGKIDIGKKIQIQQQLFKGNKYCFFIAGDFDDGNIDVKISQNNNKEKLEYTIIKEKRVNLIHFTPKNTGSYQITFAINTKDTDLLENKVNWAITYAYK